MLRLIAAAAIALALLFGGSAAPAQHVPELGCHGVYVTPPGWSQPVRVTVCP